MDGYIKKQEALEAVFKARRLVDARVRIDFLQPDEDVVKVVRCSRCLNTDKPDEYTIWCTGRGYPHQLVPPDGFCDKGRSEHVSVQ